MACEGLLKFYELFRHQSIFLVAEEEFFYLKLRHKIFVYRNVCFLYYRHHITVGIFGHFSSLLEHLYASGSVHK